MSHIHFTGGEKGGVGKSVLARLLAQFHIDRKLPLRAFDSDRSHGALLRFYGEFSSAIDLSDYDSVDQLMEAAVETERNVLVDLAAQSSRPLFQWMADNDLLGLAADEGVKVTLWHVMDDGADGINLLQKVFDEQGDRLSYVIVRNLGRGKDFSELERSRTRAAANTLDAPVITLPELHAATMRKLDHGDLSFWAASENKATGLGLMERQRVRVWMRKAYEQFDSLGAGRFTAAARPTLVVADEAQAQAQAEPAA